MERGLSHLGCRVIRDVIARIGSSISDFRVEICDEQCVLRGSARSYYAKQIAQAMAGQIAEFSSIVNEITVVPRGMLENNLANALPQAAE